MKILVSRTSRAVLKKWIDRNTVGRTLDEILGITDRSKRHILDVLDDKGDGGLVFVPMDTYVLEEVAEDFGQVGPMHGFYVSITPSGYQVETGIAEMDSPFDYSDRVCRVTKHHRAEMEELNSAIAKGS